MTDVFRHIGQRRRIAQHDLLRAKICELHRLGHSVEQIVGALNCSPSDCLTAFRSIARWKVGKLTDDSGPRHRVGENCGIPLPHTLDLSRLGPGIAKLQARQDARLQRALRRQRWLRAASKSHLNMAELRAWRIKTGLLGRENILQPPEPEAAEIV